MGSSGVEVFDTELKGGFAAFADVVAVPAGDLDGNVAFYDSLATEARAQGQTGGHFQAVELIVFGFREIRLAFLYDHVASGTGATSAAGVFQMDAKVQANVEKRFGFPVIAVGELAGFELHSSVFRQKSHFRHILLYDPAY